MRLKQERRTGEWMERGEEKDGMILHPGSIF